MTQVCETIKIKPSHKSQGDFVEINKEDFDPKLHEKFEEKKGKKLETPEKAQDHVADGEQPSTSAAVEKPTSKKAKK